MDFEIVLLRGNSSSGKTTIARRLQTELDNVILISQDVIRRDMLQESDHIGRDTMRIIEAMIIAARQMDRLIILEGIFRKDIYGNWLAELSEQYAVSAWYFDASLRTTKARHEAREQSKQYPSEILERWYRPHDIIIQLNETLIPETWSEQTTVDKILQDISGK